jgi:hypothetical protein
MEQNLTAQIRQLAYEIWEKEGRPDGRERIHWLRAEAEIRERMQPSSLVVHTRLYRVIARAPKAPPPLPFQLKQVPPRYVRLAKG